MCASGVKIFAVICLHFNSLFLYKSATNPRPHLGGGDASSGPARYSSYDGDMIFCMALFPTQDLQVARF